MKRLILLLLLLLPGVIFASAPFIVPQLSYKFANPMIFNSAGTNYFQFDVQVSSSVDTYLWANQIKLSFNNSAFDGPSIGVGLIGLYATNKSGFPAKAKYTVTNTVTGTAPSQICNIGITSNASVGTAPNSNDFVLVTSTPTTMVTVYAPLLIVTGDQLAAIDFQPSGMNGFEQYQSAANTEVLYANPNIYDSHNFLTSYTGRIYSTTNGWTQIGGSLNWATSVATTVWEGTPTMPSGVANAKALQIQSPATLTIPVDGQVTVTGTPGNTEIGTTNGLIIQSGALGTGSFITNSVSGAGTAQSNIFMTGNAWHLVSSPVTQTVQNFLTNNSNVPTNGSNRGMMDYNPSGNVWNSFFTTGAANGSVGAGRGFCLRTSADGVVTSAGALQYGTESLSGLISNYWNCVGNPYSSAIKMNTNADASNNFISVNYTANNLDPAYAAIYVWDPVLNGYTVYNNSSSAVNLPQGQAFMVKMNTSATNLSFTEAMQIHSPALALKSIKSAWPTIKLKASINNTIQNSTLITYNSGMTKGLDPTFDAGLFKGESDLVIYTRLVDDTGNPFAIQALPNNNFNGMIIPVGIESKTGGEVVFTADILDLPAEAKVILEDKLTSTFTNLATSSYKAIIAPNSVIADRFRLHNSTSTTQSAIGDPSVGGNKLNAYAYQNVEIRIVGNVTSEAVATLYDVTGKAVIIKKLSEGSLNVIPVSSVSSGLYLLTVRDGVNTQTFKILLKD